MSKFVGFSVAIISTVILSIMVLSVLGQTSDTLYFYRDGSRTATGNWNINSQDLTNVGDLTVVDDALLRVGTTGDGVLVNVSVGVGANTPLANVLVGTPVTQALAANSQIRSNITASGDFGEYVNVGGNSLEAFHIDASTQIVKIGHGLTGGKTVIGNNLDVGGYLGRFGNNGDVGALISTILRLGHSFTLTDATTRPYGIHLGISATDVTNATHTGTQYALPIDFGLAASNTADWNSGTGSPTINAIMMEANFGNSPNTYAVDGVTFVDLGGIQNLGANVTITDVKGIRIGTLGSGTGTITNAYGIFFNGEPSKGSIATDTDISLKFNVRGTGSFDVYDDNVKTLDFTSGAFAFQQATTISTAANALTLDPATNVIIPDTKGLAFGTAAGESIISSDGSDTIWQIVNGGITVGLGASAPSPDLDGLHIWKATAGTVAPIANTLVTIENSTTAYVSFLSPNNAAAGFIWTDPETTGSFAGKVLYNHNSDALTITLNGSDNLSYTNAAFAFQKATAISTTAGDLTFSPAADVNITTNLGVNHVAFANVTGNAIVAAGGIAFTDVLNAWIDNATHGTGTVVHYIGNETIDTTASTRKVKENFAPVNKAAKQHLATLSNLLQEYDYKNGMGHFVGLVAEDVREVLPQYVVGADSLSLRYQYMVGPLLWGWQDHDKRIEQLEEQLIALGGKIE